MQLTARPSPSGASLATLLRHEVEPLWPSLFRALFSFALIPQHLWPLILFGAALLL